MKLQLATFLAMVSYVVLAAAFTGLLTGLIDHSV